MGQTSSLKADHAPEVKELEWVVKFFFRTFEDCSKFKLPKKYRDTHFLVEGVKRSEERIRPYYRLAQRN